MMYQRSKPVAGIAKDSVAIESKLVALAAWMKEYYGDHDTGA